MNIRPVRYGDRGLKDLIKEFSTNCQMAEIGSYKGDSAKIWLDSGKIETLYCIDRWENYGHVHFMDIVECAFDNNISAYGDKVIKIKLESIKAVNLFLDKSLDVIYIDADHRKEAVENDIKIWKPKLKEGGILCGHDYRYNKGTTLLSDCALGIICGLRNVPQVIYADSSWMIRL